MTAPPVEEELRGELRDELERAMHRLPELGTGRLTFTALSGGITNRNYLVSGAPGGARFVVRLAGNDTHLLGISREVEHAATVTAAGVGVGPEVVAYLRPEGYLVTRFIEGRPVPIEELLQTRLFPSRVTLPQEWARYYRGEVRTRRIAKERRHRLKLAA